MRSFLQKKFQFKAERLEETNNYTKNPFESSS